MALNIGPFVGARISLVANSLIGDFKGEWFTDSAEAAIEEAIRLARTPDTTVWLFDCTNEGDRDEQRGPWAYVARNGVGEPVYNSYTHL
jgi:hypothetical protein